jgi:hypothetical protein
MNDFDKLSASELRTLCHSEGEKLGEGMFGTAYRVDHMVIKVAKGGRGNQAMCEELAAMKVLEEYGIPASGLVIVGEDDNGNLIGLKPYIESSGLTVRDNEFWDLLYILEAECLQVGVDDIHCDNVVHCVEKQALVVIDACVG